MWKKYITIYIIMELAIPLVALGGFYVISNQSKKEGYENMGKNDNNLPNTHIPAKNYPTLAPVSKSNVERYPNSNAVTDKYYDEQVYEKVANKPDQFGDKRTQGELSLTGKPIEKSTFKHNNMVPFFGAKIKGRTVDANISEGVLDNMAGTGSQQIRKTEIAPLFAPQENLQYANGVPNQSDFYQSRVMPSSNMSNVKPWEEQKVGPGLDKGFCAEGNNGFNAGLTSRDKWVDRNVDELRVKTNPKLTFSLDNHEGPAHYYINNPASAETQGKVEKYLPDTFFINTPDRWLTTTGLEKGQTSRAIEVDKDVNRPTTTTEYFGSNSNAEGNATYVGGKHEAPTRPQLDPNAVTNCQALNQFSSTDGDYGVKGYNSLPNNRCTTRSTDYAPIGGAIKAAVAPLLDLLRPSRKENVIGNARPYGDIRSEVPAMTVFNPADRAPTTIKETTVGLLDCNHLNVENQDGGGYQVSKQQPVENQRDTTNCSYSGITGGSAAQTGNTVYNAAYNQRNNVNKTYKSRPNQGNMSMFNGDENIRVKRKDGDRENNRMWAPEATQSAVPSTETYGKVHVPQYYDECQTCDRIQPDILDAFKQNPYTQSLHSWAAP